MGFVRVFPHKSRPEHEGHAGPLGPMKVVRAKGGKVRIGSAKVAGGPVSYRFVPIAPVFDPDAVSMVPIPGWKAPDASNARIVWSAADGWHDGPRVKVGVVNGRFAKVA